LIFVTTGSLFAFDRLIRAMDQLAATLPQERFFAQIGDSSYHPQRIEHVRLLPRREFLEKAAAAKLMVAHAGMGSVLTAMDLGKPIVLVPRRLELSEHNTDHQMATARWLEGRRGVHVCFDDANLRSVIETALAGEGPASEMARAAPEDFIRKIRNALAAS